MWHKIAELVWQFMASYSSMLEPVHQGLLKDFIRFRKDTLHNISTLLSKTVEVSIMLISMAITLYAKKFFSIMLTTEILLLYSKLCQHNVPRPTQNIMVKMDEKLP